MSRSWVGDSMHLNSTRTSGSRQPLMHFSSPSLGSRQSGTNCIERASRHRRRGRRALLFRLRLRQDRRRDDRLGVWKHRHHRDRSRRCGSGGSRDRRRNHQEEKESDYEYSQSHFND